MTAVGPAGPGQWWALSGFAIGVLLTAAASFWAARRQLARIRRAERRARAAERMAEIGAMTGGLAHEIKNPLSTIGLNAQLLAEAIGELPLAEDERTRLQRRIGALRREADRLRAILEDVLDSAGEVRLSREPVDLNQVVEELADFFLPQAETPGVRLRTAPAPAPAIASVDARMVKQALLNLMLNAVRAMEDSPEGVPRELILRVRPGQDDERRGIVAIHVADTGPGIDPKAAGRIFQPYFTTRSGGTGLGLPTSRRIVEAHGGRLDFTSEPGKGAEFVAEFPV
ncbi:MAG: sensor histidine kinase [Phycisphaerales bacterium JB039]